MINNTDELKEYLKTFIPRDKWYVLDIDKERFLFSYQLIKQYQADFKSEDIVVDIGSRDAIFLPLMDDIYHFKNINVIDYGLEGKKNDVIENETRKINFTRHYLNLETDLLPFTEQSVELVIFLEVIEHLLYDPMSVLLEINRIMKKNALLFLSTPNLNSARAFSKMLKGDNPNLYTPYHGKNASLYERHNREYTIKELKILLNNSGFSIDFCTTHPVFNKKIVLLIKVFNWLNVSPLNQDKLGDYIHLVCRKKSDISTLDQEKRFPKPIYQI